MCDFYLASRFRCRCRCKSSKPFRISLISVFDYKITVNENPYIERSDNQNIHLFTQERLLIFEALNKQKIDYIVFDEVQELLSIVKKAHAERAVLLAKSISLYENKNVPMVFLMPYIQNPEEDFLNFFTDIEFFVKKDLYSPTTSNKYLITRENKTYYLNDVTKNKGFDKSFAQTASLQTISPTKLQYLLG